MILDCFNCCHFLHYQSNMFIKKTCYNERLISSLFFTVMFECMFQQLIIIRSTCLQCLYSQIYFTWPQAAYKHAARGPTAFRGTIQAMKIKGEVQQWDRGRSSINIKSRFQLKIIIRNDSLYFFFFMFSMLCSFE